MELENELDDKDLQVLTEVKKMKRGQCFGDMALMKGSGKR